MRIIKKLIALLLASIIAISSSPFVCTVEASAPNYNPQAALAFARENAMRTDINWLCAEFVARAVRAGGLDINIYRGTGSLNRAIARTLGISWTAGTNPPAAIPRLQLNANGHATQALNGNTLMPGDVVLQFCMETSTGCAGPISPHVLIFSRYDGDGIARFYGRNRNIADARWALDHRTQGRNSLHPNCRNIAGFVLQIAPRTGGGIITQTNETVRYDANGGTGAPTSHGWRLEDGFIDYILIPNTVPTRPGYRFLGWDTQRDGSPPFWQPGQVVTSHIGPQNWTLFAQWSQSTSPQSTACNHSWSNVGICTRCNMRSEDAVMNITSLSNQARYTTRANAPIRPRPYDTGTYNRRESQIGTQITVNGHGTNTRGNVWYRVQGGGWIYSGNLSTTNPTSPAAAPQGQQPIIGPTPVPNGTVGERFGGHQGLHLLSGSSRDATWRISAGSLPPGVTFSNNAAFGGSPTQAGTFTFTIEARNNYGVATRQFTVTIAESPNIYIAVRFNTNGGTGSIADEQLRFTPSDDAQIVHIRDRHITTRSGYVFLGWTIPGIVDHPNPSQLFIGRQDLQGRAELTAIAQWAQIDNPLQPYIIYESLRSGRVGVSGLSEGIGARFVHIRNNLTDNWDNVNLYPFVVVRGSLPPGMGISRIGIFNGTPTQAGTFTFTIRFTNPSGHFAEQEYTITIHP